MTGYLLARGRHELGEVVVGEGVAEQMPSGLFTHKSSLHLGAAPILLGSC